MVGGGDLVRFDRDLAEDIFSCSGVVVAAGVVGVGEREEVVLVDFEASVGLWEFDKVAK